MNAKFQINGVTFKAASVDYPEDLAAEYVHSIVDCDIELTVHYGTGTFVAYSKPFPPLFSLN